MYQLLTLSMKFTLPMVLHVSTLDVKMRSAVSAKCTKEGSQEMRLTLAELMPFSYFPSMQVAE